MRHVRWRHARRELGILALEKTLTRLLAAEQKHYVEVVHVLQQLISRAERRQLAWPHFQTSVGLLDGYSDANCPMSFEEVRDRTTCTPLLGELLTFHGIHMNRIVVPRSFSGSSPVRGIEAWLPSRRISLRRSRH